MCKVIIIRVNEIEISLRFTGLYAIWIYVILTMSVCELFAYTSYPRTVVYNALMLVFRSLIAVGDTEYRNVDMSILFELRAN